MPSSRRHADRAFSNSTMDYVRGKVRYWEKLRPVQGVSIPLYGILGCIMLGPLTQSIMGQGPLWTDSQTRLKRIPFLNPKALTFLMHTETNWSFDGVFKSTVSNTNGVMWCSTAHPKSRFHEITYFDIIWVNTYEGNHKQVPIWAS